MIWPQVPAEQRTQRLWCGECFVSDTIGIDEVAEELGWSEGLCPDCAGPRRSRPVKNIRVPIRGEVNTP